MKTRGASCGAAPVGLVLVLFWLICTEARSAESLIWSPAGSSETLVTNSVTIMSGIKYFRGSKDRVENDPGKSFEIFQRRLNDGTLETKQVNKRAGKIKSSEYHIQNGWFFDSDGELLKFGYERDYQIEERIAHSQSKPYIYEQLSSKSVGTNDCIVIRRKMSDQMLSAVGAELFQYKTNLTDVQRSALFKKNVRAIDDYYIRKNDGIQLGSLRRNAAGDLLDDRLCDQVIINEPIPDQEFTIPNMEKAVPIASFEDFGAHLTQQFLQKNAFREPGSQPTGRKRYMILVTLCIVSLATAGLLARQLWFRKT